MIKIYGASDDLVEVEGVNLSSDPDADGGQVTGVARAGAEDEIGCYNETVEFTIGDRAGGVVVRMDYGLDGEPGVWAARIRQIDDGAPVPWPVRIELPGGPRHREAGYSVAVVIECPDGTPATCRRHKIAAAESLRQRADDAERALAKLRPRLAELEGLERAVAKAMTKSAGTHDPFVAPGILPRRA